MKRIADVGLPVFWAMGLLYRSLGNAALVGLGISLLANVDHVSLIK